MRLNANYARWLHRFRGVGKPTYEEWLKSKIVVNETAGFEVDLDQLHESLFHHQKVTVQWALKLGRGLITKSFGLGKTRDNIEICRQVVARLGGIALVVSPLGVKHQFQEEDGPAMGTDWQYVRTDEEIEAATSPYLITNYERIRDGNIDPRKHNITVAGLDEGAVLRSLGSKTYNVFIKAFADVPYRYVFTAVPSPNNYKELIYYANFLGVMDTGQSLTRWFKRDSQKAGNLTLYQQHERDFWLWVASWALFIYKPSDVNGDDTGYDLPELKVHWHRVPVDHKRAWDQTDSRGQARLILNAANGVSEASQEKRHTMAARLEKMIEIVTFEDGEHRSDNAARIQQGILPSPSRGREETQARALPPEQAQDRPREAESVHAGVSENLQAEADNPRTEGGAQPQEKREVRHRQGVSRAGEETRTGVDQEKPAQEEGSTAEGEVQHGTGGVSANAGSTGGQVRDLRLPRQDEPKLLSASGSLSQNGGGPGDSLHELQPGIGQVRRRSGATNESGGIFDQWVIWCHLNDEQSGAKSAIEEQNLSTSSIYGTLSIEETERRLYEWLRRKTHVLLGKPVMLGLGLNLQQCNRAVFVGVDYKFADFIQAVHRIYRFGQERPVDVHIIYAESEDDIVTVLKRKWRQHDKLVARMRRIVQKYDLSGEALRQELSRKIGVERQEYKSKLFTAVNNDCVLEMPRIADNSIDMILTSPPFGRLYEYTIQIEDMGHNVSDDKFWEQMDFLIPHLLRTLKPGRVAAIHVKDRILYGHLTESGFMEVSPFTADCIKAFTKHGFLYAGKHYIVTDVVRENNATYRLGYSEMCRDASKMGAGLGEELLLFRKPPTTNVTARADEPVTKEKSDYSLGRWQVDAHGLYRSNGNRLLAPDELAQYVPDQVSKLFAAEQLNGAGYDYDRHIAVCDALEMRGRLPKDFMLLPPKVTRNDADPVWDDIIYMRTLNSQQSQKRRENHLCPLPLDIVKRAIRLYSNEGEMVLDPFGGLGTVGYCAIEMGRRAYLAELSAEYWAAAVGYCEEMERKVSAPTLFDYLEKVQEAENVLR